MKAVALLSGGLDSSLAVKIMLDQGIEVIAINFLTPFFLCDRKRGCRKKAIVMAEKLNIQLKLFNISKEYLEIVKKPSYGYGRNLNPCIDCRIMMLKKAKEFMDEIGASFVITGEVLGQRPMSQNKKAMQIIEQESGLKGLIVRPLSAKSLPQSIPEKQGWVNREKLLGIVGRSRKRQLELASKFNISDYASPAGGCLLTDPVFSLIVKDLMKSDMLNIENINLVKNGRYFRISDSFKLIVGRNQKENQILINAAKEGDLIVEPEIKGPIAIGRGKIENESVRVALKIVAYYCKPSHQSTVKTSGVIRINFRIFPEDKKHTVVTQKINKEELLNYRVR